MPTLMFKNEFKNSDALHLFNDLFVLFAKFSRPYIYAMTYVFYGPRIFPPWVKGDAMNFTLIYNNVASFPFRILPMISWFCV